MPAGAASVFALRRGIAAVGGSPSRIPSIAPRSLPPAARRHKAASSTSVRRSGGSLPTLDSTATANGTVGDTATTTPSLDDILAQAGQLANAGRHHDAIVLCEEARAAVAPSPELFFLMGMLHQAAGDLDRAEGCFHKTLYLDASHDEALLALALLASQRGDATMAATYRQSAARVMARKEAT